MLGLVLVAVVAAAFGVSARSSSYFLALIIPITLGVSMSEAFYTALLPSFGSTGGASRAVLRQAMRRAAPLAIAATAAYAAAIVVASPSHLSVWLAFAPVVGAAALNGVYAAFLTAIRRYRLALLRVPLATALAVAFVAVVFPGWRSTTAVALGVSCGQLVTLGILVWSARTAPEGEAAGAITFADLFASASTVFAATLVGGQLVIVLERFLASSLLPGAVALLAFARGLALLPAMLAQALGGGIFPAATERFEALERASLDRLALTGLRLSLLAALVSTTYVVLCRQELVRIALQRHAFGAGDARETATLVAILAGSLAGVSAAATGAKTLFALGRRRLVLTISAASVAVYVVAAVVLRYAYGLDGLAAAFTVAASIGGAAFLVALASALRLRPLLVVHEWLAAPAAFAAAFAAGAVAVWLLLHDGNASVAEAIATAAGVGLAGLVTLGIAIRLARGPEYSLLRTVAARPG